MKKTLKMWIVPFYGRMDWLCPMTMTSSWKYKGIFELKRHGEYKNMVSTIRAYVSPKKGRNKVSMMVSVPSWHVKPVANAHIYIARKSVKVEFIINVLKFVKSLIGCEVTATATKLK